jgi:glycosyltransferase involved in cell wall biosynthesis
MNISVCIATYNGGKYIETQLNSIVDQLEINDEVIIVDDCSKDNTIKIIESFKDSRIKIIKNEVNKGHVYSFNRALELSSKDIIFMSDQDDVWKENRVFLIKEKLLKSNALLLSSNSEFINSQGDNLNYKIDGVDVRNSSNYYRNILDIFIGKTNYYGCLMAFKRELKKVVLPIPDFVESHDLWIAKAGNILKSNIHCNDITLARRIHETNASTTNRSIIFKIKSRIIFFISIVVLFIRKINNE